MRVAILDDLHRAYEGTTGVSRLRDRAEVQISLVTAIDVFHSVTHGVVEQHCDFAGRGSHRLGGVAWLQ
jgi:hypothetical protein